MRSPLLWFSTVRIRSNRHTLVSPPSAARRVVIAASRCGTSTVGVETISKMRGVSAPAGRPARYQQVINDRVYPPPFALRIEQLDERTSFSTSPPNQRSSSRSSSTERFSWMGRPRAHLSASCSGEVRGVSRSLRLRSTQRSPRAGRSYAESAVHWTAAWRERRRNPPFRVESEARNHCQLPWNPRHSPPSRAGTYT